MMRQRNVGDRQQIYMGNTCLDGVVTRVSVIDEEHTKGVLEGYVFDEYGDTQDFWFPDDGMLESQSECRRNRSMMPKEFVYKRAKDFQWDLYDESTREQKKVANAFILQFESFRKQGRGLYIYSKTKGSGKTMLACCLANEIMNRRDLSVKFITVPEYIELVKSKVEQERELLTAIYNCGLLILDDVGAETDKQEWIVNSVFRLVDYRDKQLLPTIYTSNYDMYSLHGDERTVERIIGHSVPVPMPEKSIRRMKAMQKTGEFLKELLGNCQEDNFV